MPIDYSKYPKNWKEIRARILEREQHRCKFCGIDNYEVIFRGILEGKEVFQRSDGNCFTYPSGSFHSNNIFDVEPINGDINQKAIKVILTIAHLDHDEENHNVKDERLAALCQKCHLNYDKEEKAKRREVNKYQKTFFPIIKTKEEPFKIKK